MKATISFHFQHPSFRLRHRQLLRQWLLRCTHAEGQGIASLRYLFCTDAHILEANKQFLQHDYYTDILTFGDHSAAGISGDILISIDRVRDNAKTHGTKPIDELHRVMSHGALHLLGHSDHTPEQQQAMRTKEDAWLAQRPAFNA